MKLIGSETCIRVEEIHQISLCVCELRPMKGMASSNPIGLTVQCPHLLWDPQKNQGQETGRNTSAVIAEVLRLGSGGGSTGEAGFHLGAAPGFSVKQFTCPPLHPLYKC